MTRQRLETLALVIVMGGAVLFVPPLVFLFLHDMRLFGVPLPVAYFFLAWGALIALAAWLAPRMPSDPPSSDQSER